MRRYSELSMYNPVQTKKHEMSTISKWITSAFMNLEVSMRQSHSKYHVLKKCGNFTKKACMALI